MTERLDSTPVRVGHRQGGQTLGEPPLTVDAFAEVEPVYEELPGWKESTVGINRYDALPANARAYLSRIQDLVGVPIDVISTGADRDHTIVLRHPFG